MQPAADSSGGLRMDPATVRQVAQRLDEAADRLDGAGGGVPRSGDYGLAGPVLSVLPARFCETGARIGLEAQTLASAVIACHDSTLGTDQAEAERLLVTGEVDE